MRELPFHNCITSSTAILSSLSNSPVTFELAVTRPSGKPKDILGSTLTSGEQRPSDYVTDIFLSDSVQLCCHRKVLGRWRGATAVEADVWDARGKAWSQTQKRLPGDWGVRRLYGYSWTIGLVCDCRKYWWDMSIGRRAFSVIIWRRRCKQSNK